VLELQPVESDVVGCYASPAALDSLAGNGGLPIRLPIRVAPGELLLLGWQQRLSELVAELGRLDPSSLVVDLTSAFSIWGLRGDARFEAFCRLSQLELPETAAVVQGLVAHVPARVVVVHDELLVVTSSSHSHHFRERLLTACVDLAPVEGAARTLERATKQAMLA
jgi:hypothetical protein